MVMIQTARILKAISSLSKERPGRFIPNWEIADRAGLHGQDLHYSLAVMARRGLITSRGRGRTRTLMVVSECDENMRPCLRCRKPFLSGWNGNRLCKACLAYAYKNSSSFDMTSFGSGSNGHRAGARRAE